MNIGSLLHDGIILSNFENTLPLSKLSFKRANAGIGNVFYHVLFVKKKYIFYQEILIFELFIEIKFIELI